MRTEKVEKLLMSGRMTPFDMANVKKAQIYKIIEKYRWADNGGKPYCSRCGNCEKFYKIKTRRQYRCKDCNYTFSLLVHTSFSNHSFRGETGLARAFYMLSLFAQNISARKAAIYSGVNRKTAWFFLQKVRNTLDNYNHDIKLKGIIEIDGVYFYKDRFNPERTRVAIFARERSSNPKIKGAILTKVFVALSENSKDILKFALKHFVLKSEIQTDEHVAYKILKKPLFRHRAVKHAEEYVSKYGVNNNQCESLNARAREIIQRQSRGVRKNYFLNYLFEVAYRGDSCHLSEGDIFLDLFKRCLRSPVPDDLVGYYQGNRRIGERIGVE